ncbi:MAG: flagellin FliC [Vampirovibrionales bacterium]|nr:flagellin FliC [Vampirovibrionales bacterium]
MPLIINTNTMSLNAQRNLGANTNALAKSLEKLSSGYRINRAGDDAAGLQVSERLRTQIRGSQKALDNVQDGVNVLNIADGAMSVLTENLQRMRELAVQAANSTYSAGQRVAIKQELDARAADITRIANATQFNGVFLLNGTANSLGNFTLQVGPNNISANDTIDIGATGAFNAVNATSLAVNNLLVDNIANSQATLGAVDAAIDTVNSRRGLLGSVVNQLSSAQENLQISIENLQSAESRIRNVDVAAESATMARNQILQQSALTVLAQANQAPSLALKLLQ